MHKRITVLIAFITLSLLTIAWAEPKGAIKLAFIDIQKALNTCEAGKNAAAKLQKELEQAQKKYEAQGEELKAEKETMERQANLLDEDVLRDRMRDFQSKYRDWERFRKDTENDIRQKHDEMVAQITKELVEIAGKIGEEGGYTLIVERSMVPYIDTSLDVTEEAIKRHNEQYGQKKPAKSGQ
ncbi:MAG: OmpH family outer membrane protein [Deltaproteobacteria bacterium]|nr:OmpH family outer membrane protein [Deltaproteobacteria bacterium]